MGIQRLVEISEDVSNLLSVVLVLAVTFGHRSNQLLSSAAFDSTDSVEVLVLLEYVVDFGPPLCSLGGSEIFSNLFVESGSFGRVVVCCPPSLLDQIVKSAVLLALLSLLGRHFVCVVQGLVDGLFNLFASLVKVVVQHHVVEY